MNKIRKSFKPSNIDPIDLLSKLIPRNNNYDFSAHKDLREHVEEMQTYLFTVRDEIDKVMHNLNMLSVKLT